MRDWEELIEEEKNKELRNTEIDILVEKYVKDERYIRL